MTDVRIGDDAENEYIQALVRYGRRSLRAANGFEAAFDDVVKQIGDGPHQFPETEVEGFRFATIRGYPFSVI